METEAAHTSEQMCGAYKLHRETTSPLRIRKERGSSCLLSHWDLLIKGATWKRMKRIAGFRVHWVPGSLSLILASPARLPGTAFPSLSSTLSLTAAARQSSLLLAGLLSFTLGTLPGPTWYVLHFICLESGLETEER